jgi:DNA polymerase epsilon subunit 3
MCAGFNEVQTSKRNAYRQKVAADKMAGGGGEEGEGPAAKKVRTQDGGVEVGGEMRDAAAGEEEETGEDEEEHEDDPEEDDDEDEQEGENEHERLDVEEPLEEIEQREGEDEALDNGEDSE